VRYRLDVSILAIASLIAMSTSAQAIQSCNPQIHPSGIELVGPVTVRPRFPRILRGRSARGPILWTACESIIGVNRGPGQILEYQISSGTVRRRGDLEAGTREIGSKVSATFGALRPPKSADDALNLCSD
jgi:hypothetical protein